MRGVAWLLLAPLILAACGSKPSGQVTASRVGVVGVGDGGSCAAPYLNNQPATGTYSSPTPTVSPGEELTIYGHWYTSTCNDTNGAHDPLEPLPPVHLILTLPGGKVEPLGEFTPGGRDMGFSAPVRIPAATRAGTAKISDDRSPHPAIYRFAVGPA